jgi:thiosulfate/3-mercaptopyruvate sulfurtransferase
LPTTYPRAELLVEPAWLAEHAGEPGLVLIDCDPAEVRDTRQHIPGAQPFPIHPYFRDTETFTRVAPPEQAEQVLRSLGVDDDSTVVLYDQRGNIYAARVWWVMWYYGFENAVILNGGWTAWQAEGLPTTDIWADAPKVGNFTARPVPERHASCETMLPYVNRPEFVPLDVRDDLEWSGGKTAPNATNQREGRIPGAVHIEWLEFVDADDANRFKSPEWIDERLVGAGVTRDKRVVPY